MEAKDTLWHIDWGDGDTCFVIAPDEKTAKERMLEGGDMVNSIVRLDSLYQMIFKAGIKEVVEWVESHEESSCMDCSCAYDFKIWEWQTECKKWGIRRGVKLPKTLDSLMGIDPSKDKFRSPRGYSV